MSRLASSARTHAFDALVAVAAVGGALEVALRGDSLREPGTSPWPAAAAVALVVLPLLGHRRSPFAAAVSVWVLAAAVSLADGQLVTSAFSASAAGIASAFMLGHLPHAARSRLGLAVVLGGAAIVVYNDPDLAFADVFFTPVLFAIAWLAGRAVRERSAQAEAAEERAAYAEREREAAARIAVAEERTRIARELHDIVAHAVSVMVLHVGAVRHRLPQTLDEDKSALRSVEDTGRTALAEMRHLLGALRDAHEDVEPAPQPGLGSLDSLVEEVGRAGLPVRLRVDGEPFPLPRAVDLSAYRIIQEGLTNTRKHARASRADVVVGYGRDDLEIEVRDDGHGPAETDGLGHGLVGVRERVKIHGGEMTAGSATGGGFVLRARLPLGGRGT